MSECIRVQYEMTDEMAEEVSEERVLGIGFFVGLVLGGIVLVVISFGLKKFVQVRQKVRQ